MDHILVKVYNRGNMLQLPNGNGFDRDEEKQQNIAQMRHYVTEKT